MKVSKTKAIQIARQSVGQIYSFGGDYQFALWDIDCQAWYNVHRSDYWQARAARSELLIKQALLAAGADSDAIDTACYQYACNGGRWIDYV